MKLRVSQVETLRALDALEGDATVGEIAERLDLTDARAEGRLERLELRGLIAWKHSGRLMASGHFWAYRLTPLGREALDESEAG